MVFKDLDTAFDRVSHTCLMIPHRCACNSRVPQKHAVMDGCASFTSRKTPALRRRRVVLNGKVSRELSMLAGVVQGCPLSTLLFLFVIEALNRLIRKDNNLAGTKIDITGHKL